MRLAERLTATQLRIVQLAAQEMTVKEIAAEMGLTYHQVRAQINGWNGIYERLDVRGMVGACRALWESEMSEQAEPEKPVERGWQVRQDAVHWLPEALPAGEPAWTDYRGDDCLLRRRKHDDRSNPVRVNEPLFPSARVKVKPQGGEWVAVRE